MTKIIEKIVESKYAPRQTNVIWLDISGDKPVKKSYINGKWVIVGGGNIDYSEVQNKPQINGVELVGNKSTIGLGIYSNTQKVNITRGPNNTAIIPFNVYGKCGTISQTTQFNFLIPIDNEYDNVILHYTWSFDIGSTIPNITYPKWNNKNLVWIDSEEPPIEANKHYEISVVDGYATCLVFDLLQ